MENPFNKCSYFYNIYTEYIKISSSKQKQSSESPELLKYPDSKYYNIIGALPSTIKDDNTIIISELDISRDINTESIHNIISDSSSPTEYTGTETFEDDPQYLQISSDLKTINEPVISRYIFRPIPILQTNNLSIPIKSIKNKRASGRRPNMPLYDDKYHVKNREYIKHKKHLIYKSMKFSKFLDTYCNLSRYRFYLKFKNWLDANNIINLEKIKFYYDQCKKYRNIIYETL